MKYTVTVKTQANKNIVKQLDHNTLEVHVSITAEGGKANEKVTSLLADYFDVPKWKIFIVTGHRSPHKVIEVMF